MAKLTSIGISFTARLLAVSMGVLGLIAGILYSFGGLYMDFSGDSLNSGTALAFLALVGMPLLFAASGYCAGALLALLYNLAAKFGITIESELKQ